MTSEDCFLMSARQHDIPLAMHKSTDDVVAGDDNKRSRVVVAQHNDISVPQQRSALIAAVCATALLVIALLNRISLAGPCTFNSFQHSAVCVHLSSLPANVPHNTQILHCKNDVELEASAMRALNRFNFSSLRQLRELVLVRCGIEQVATDTFSFVPHLRRLDLRHNRIRRIADHQFRGISELEYLLLSDNPLVELGDAAFHGLTIGRLELADNPELSSIANTAFLSSRVVTLVLRWCNLEALRTEALQHLADSLRELIVSRNQRALTIDVDLLDGFHLRRLVLTNDQLTSVDFLTHGDHDEIVLDGNHHVWNKSSSSRRPRRVERKRTRRLSVRNASVTSLSDAVDTSMFADVEELVLSSNMIAVVTASQLIPFERLRVLDLSDNIIDQFVGNFTSALLRLDSLNLTSNRLETLPESTWRPLFERLKSSISLGDNKLHYNCELRWLVELQYLVPTDDADSSLHCVAPVITNTSVTVHDDQLYVVCEAEGDPAPRLTWTLDKDRQVGRVEPLATRRGRDVLTTSSHLPVSRLSNYTCIASNIVGQSQVTVDVVATLQSSPHGWQLVRRRADRLDIVNTPLGFTVTLALLALLAYLLKQH